MPLRNTAYRHQWSLIPLYADGQHLWLSRHRNNMGITGCMACGQSLELTVNHRTFRRVYHFLGFFFRRCAAYSSRQSTHCRRICSCKRARRSGRMRHRAICHPTHNTHFRMTIDEKYNQVLERLSREIPMPETELHYTNGYQLLTAVILSAQCTDKRINMVTPALFAAYPGQRLGRGGHRRNIRIHQIGILSQQQGQGIIRNGQGAHPTLRRQRP